MSNPSDLVTLAAVKAWLNIPGTDSDTLLAPWITGASRAVLNMLQRGSILGFRSINEVRDGNGSLYLQLLHWPVLSVSALTIVGQAQVLQTDPPLGTGFYWEKWDGLDDTAGHQRLFCAGTRFYRGPPQNISISYTAGYQVQNETQLIPSGSPHVVTTNRPWYSDQGVSIGGTALTPVAGVPSTGQYSVAQGVYTFNAAQGGETAAITYSYTPEDLQQCVIDLVAWHFRNRDRIGQMARTMGGQETTSFSQKALGETSLLMLQPFKNVAPLL